MTKSRKYPGQDRDAKFTVRLEDMTMVGSQTGRLPSANPPMANPPRKDNCPLCDAGIPVKAQPNFEELEKRILANQPPDLDTNRSRAKKALDFGRAYGSTSPPETR